MKTLRLTGLLTASFLFIIATAQPAHASLIGYNFFLLDDSAVPAYTGELFIDSSLMAPSTFYSFTAIAAASGGNLSITIEGSTFALADATRQDTEGIITDISGLVISFHDDASGLSIGFFNAGLDFLNIVEGNSNWGVIPLSGSGPAGPSHSFVRIPIPEPSTLLLFGAGLAGLAGVWRRRRRR